jgi:hypothetical protein
MSDNRSDSFGDHLAGRSYVAIRRRTADKDKHVSAKRSRIVDGPTIVVNLLPSLARRCCWKKSTSTETGYFQTGAANGLGRVCCVSKLMSPRPNPVKPMADTSLDGLFQGSALGCDLVQAEPIQRSRKLRH